MEYVVDNWQNAVGLALIYGVIQLITLAFNKRSENKRLKLDNARLENEKKVTENQTIDIQGKALQTALAAQLAMQEQIATIQQDRVKLTEVLIANQNKIDKLEDMLHKQRLDAETVNAQMSAELVKLRAALAQAQGKIATLERELEARDIKIREQDQKIVLLSSENERLKCDLDVLQAKVNGKVDKPKTEPIEPIEMNDAAPDDEAHEPKEQL